LFFVIWYTKTNVYRSATGMVGF